MSNLYAEMGARFRNEMRQSCAALMGIVQGILADGALHDREIVFLRDWLASADNVSLIWPGSVLYAQVKEILADGTVTSTERDHLAGTLLQLLGGTLDQLGESRHVTSLPMDQLSEMETAQRVFCFTGEFAFGPRTACQEAVTRRGGTIAGSVTKKLNYLIVGGLGSPEWKHGSFGTKIEKAIEYRQAGVPMKILHEDTWAGLLRG